MPNYDMVPLMKVPQNRVLQRNDKSVILCHNQPLNVQKVTNNMVIVKNTSPPLTLSWQMANCRPTVSQQLADTKLTGHREVTNRLATGGEIALLDTIFTFYKTDQGICVHFCIQNLM